MKNRLRLAIGLALTMVAPAVLTVASSGTASAVNCQVTVRLSPGTTNAAVNCLEQRLIELGYQGIGTPDNFYGTNSVHAVSHFQETRGLYHDGIVTSITGRQLGLRGGLPPATAGRVTIIGDSTSAAMRWYDEAQNVTSRYDLMGNNYDLLWSVESCRRLVSASCVGRTDPGTGNKWRPVSTLPLMKTTLYGRLGEALVIMAGYDDYTITNAIDPIMEEANKQGVSKVYWLTYRTSGSYSYGQYYAAHNNQLQAARVRHPNLIVLDWNGYTRSQSQAVQNSWFEGDQIHMKAAGAAALASWLKANIDPHQLHRCDALNTNTGVPSPTTGESTTTTDPGGFTGMQPDRVLDTRDPGNGGSAGRLGAGRSVEIDLTGAIPGNAQAASLSVAAVDPCKGGFITVYDCDVRPITSNLNFPAGKTTAALAITPLGDGQSVCVYSSAPTDVIVDVTGTFGPGGHGFVPITPTRWIDTRGTPAVQSVAVGLRGSGTDTLVQINGNGGISNATAVLLNLTGSKATRSTYLTVYPGPCGSPPNSSNVNLLTGRDAASSVLVALGAGGSFCIRVTGVSHLIVDVAGYFTADSNLLYRAGPLARPYDSRPGEPPAAGVNHQVAMGNVSMVNVTSVKPTASGFLSLKPCGASTAASLVNVFARETTANATAIAPGVGGAICATATMAGDVIVDRLGEFVVVT